MAQSNADFEVAVERVVHKFLEEGSKQIYDTHHIQILRVDIDWIDVSLIEEPAAIIENIIITTKYTPDGRE